MPKIKTSEKIIPKIYRRKYEDIAMYFFVEGQRQIVPAVTIEQALYNFFRFAQDEDFNIESAIVTFQRLRGEYYEVAKANSGSVK
jgi:hypothetical protein